MSRESLLLVAVGAFALVAIALVVATRRGGARSPERDAGGHLPSPVSAVGDAAATAATLEAQLATLRAGGIALREDRSIDDLLATWTRADFEREPYRLALVALGGEVEAEPWGRVLSNDAWHFDTECIDDEGSYVAIVERMSRLARGALPVRDVQDHVDLEAGEAWVSFRLGDETIRWEAKVEDDWVDPTILSRLAALLEAQHAGVRFTYFDLGGQDCILGAATPEQLEVLRRTTGLDFVWLE